jgi:hypothetical protein
MRSTPDAGSPRTNREWARPEQNATTGELRSCEPALLVPQPHFVRQRL